MAEAATHTTTLHLTVDGREIEARPGQTVLRACQAAGIRIPTLCDDPRLEPYGGCRLCIVEIEGMRGFPTSCTTLAAEAMQVTTQSDTLRAQRRTLVELLIAMVVNRPYPTPGEFGQVFSDLTKPSFPSGHVTSYIGIYGFVWFLVYSRVKQPWLRFPLLILLGALVVVLDREGRILRFNRACEEATGYTQEELQLHGSLCQRLPYVDCGNALAPRTRSKANSESFCWRAVTNS